MDLLLVRASESKEFFLFIVFHNTKTKTMTRDSIRLFVYGTLRRFQREIIKPDAFDIPESRKNAFFQSHTLLEKTLCLGMAKTRGILYDVGLYPAMVFGDRTIVGEVYDLEPEQLKTIDLLEGYEEKDPARSHYIRIRVPVIFEDAKSDEAEVYLYNRTVRGLTLIESGDYCQYLGSPNKME